MNFRTLDLNLLRVFAAVMVERNVTRAAAQLAMTQPAVSNALRRLREATGDELFVTVPSGVVPTAQAAGAVAAGPRRARRPAPRVRPAGLRADARRAQLHAGDGRRDGDRADAGADRRAGGASARRPTCASLPLSSRDPRPLLEQGGADLALGFFPEVAAALAAEGAAATIARSSRSTPASTSCVMRREPRARSATGRCRSTTTAPPSTFASASPAGRAASSTRRWPR